jgi:ATP-dependent protease HslVU (ClpYQ) peptidase subunit
VTTIVGVCKNGNVTLGADSQITTDSTRVNSLVMEKITKNNGYLIAGSGDASACDILQHIFIPPIPTVTERKNLYKFMITKFVPAMKEALEENDYKSDPSDKESGFSMLIAFDGELFDISDDFSVLVSDDGIYGVGIGAKWAMGALHAGASVQEALEVAAKKDIYTSGPFQIVKQQKSKKL